MYYNYNMDCIYPWYCVYGGPFVDVKANLVSMHTSCCYKGKPGECRYPCLARTSLMY